MNHAIKILATALLGGLGLAIGNAAQRQEDVPAALATGSTTEVTLVDTDFDTDPVGSLPAPFEVYSDGFCATDPNLPLGVTGVASHTGSHSLTTGYCSGSGLRGWKVQLPQYAPIIGVHVTLYRSVYGAGRSFLGMVAADNESVGQNDNDVIRWYNHEIYYIDRCCGNPTWSLGGYDSDFNKVDMIWDFEGQNLVVLLDDVEVYSQETHVDIPSHIVSYSSGFPTQTYDDDVSITVTMAADADEDGMSDDFESGFGGTIPEASLVITNPETGDLATSYRSAATGAVILSGSFDIVLPPDTSVDTGGGADHIAITLDPTLPARLAVSGADLAGGTKSIVMPFDGDASAPAVCIDDSATATVDSVLAGGECDGTLVAIPAAVGVSNFSGSFTVKRLSSSPPRVQVGGLSHTALATIALGVPRITSVTSATAPATVGSSVTASADFYDTDGDTSSATFDWGDGTTSAGTIQSGTATGSHVYTATGVYTVGVTLTDGSGHSASGSYQYVVVYNPDGGFVTGGGWINSPAGAMPANPSLTGKATFGFVAKYKQGKTEPEGNTEFQFKAGNINFKSDGDYMWLVVSGSGHKATFKGSGTINGAGDYGVMVTAIDAANTPSTNVDLFRIKIWDKADGDAVVYDNQLGTSCGTGDDADPCTAIGGGDIKIHKK